MTLGVFRSTSEATEGLPSNSDRFSKGQVPDRVDGINGSPPLRSRTDFAGATPPTTLSLVLRFLAVAAPLLAVAAIGVAGYGTAWFAFLALVQVVLVVRAPERRSGALLRLGMQITDSR